jgi:hypothetical protein
MDCAVKTRLPDGSPLNPATKLALMAFADSADRHTHIAFPGLDGVMLWAGVQKSRANELVRELVDQGLLLKHKGGHRGRRAEYVVFPAGCCSDCRPPALGATPEGPTISGAEGAPEGPATPTVQEPTTSAPESTPTAPNGYDRPDSMSGKGSAPAHPNSHKPPATPIGYGTADPIAEKGSGKGALASGPLPIFPSIPPNPQPSAGGASCAKHPNGQANCRACGTTPRQLETARVRQARAAKREREDERRRAEAAALAAARRDSTSKPVQQLLQATRQKIASGGAA